MEQTVPALLRAKMDYILQPIPVARASRFVRKMRGGSQAHLIETEDGTFYVVKFSNNPQHRRVIINELLSHILLRKLDVASPDWALIEITARFIANNPEARIQTERVCEPPPVGLHFGSRFPGNPDRVAVYDFLPDDILMKVSNLPHFLGALVFDRWVSNADARQAVFFRGPLRSFEALMIDHGGAFSGEFWAFHDSPRSGRYFRKAVYDSVHSIESFEPWLGRVVRFPENVVGSALTQVPPEWLDGDEDVLKRLLERLLRRREVIRELLLQYTSIEPRWPRKPE